MRLIMLLFSVVIAAQAVEQEERDRLHEEFSSALTELSETQQRLSEHTGTAQVVIPPGVPTQIATRRTLAAEWIRRIGTPTTDFPVEEAETFRDGLYTLRGRLDQAASWSEILATIGERWQGAISSKEFERYRVFVRSAIDQRLQEIATGAEPTMDEDLFYRRQHRHEVILSLVEADEQTTERLAKLSQEAPSVREFRAHRAALRATAEAGLQAANPVDDQVLERDQQILWLLEELVGVVQEREERLAGRDHPPAAAALASITICQSAEEQALRALIAHHRAQMPDDPAWHRQQDALRREREHRRTLASLAWEWMNLEDGVHNIRQRVQEQIPQIPPALQASATKRVSTLEVAFTEASQGLAQALRDGKRIEAVRAKAAQRLVNNDFEALAQSLGFQQERLNQENEMQARVGEPAIAALKKQLDALWTTLEAARASQENAERAVIVAELERELADVAADVARTAADFARQEADLAREQLDQRREQLIDAIENPQPKPEGDAKF